MKKFIFEVTINEGSDEFWESLDDKYDDSGIKCITEVVQDALNQYLDVPMDNVILKSFNRD